MSVPTARDRPPNPDLAYWLEMSEALAYRDSFTAAAERPTNPTGAFCSEIGGAAAFALTVIDVGFFNRVVGLGTARPATEDDVESASRFFLDLGRTQSVVHVAPGAQPDQLVGWLNARGYVAGARWVKVWHDLQEIETPNPALRIEPIDASQAQAWGDVFLSAFEMPELVRPTGTAAIGRAGWIHYLGFEREAPVCTAAMRLEGDVAWLGYGGTLDEFRGRGWQTAMLLRRLADARDRGCRLAVTETGEETEKNPVNHSYRNMLRTGFELAYARQNWVRLPAQPE
ncbi:MAG: hypothetical protein ACOYXS_04460 [Chloroflexota bacterium]